MVSFDAMRQPRTVFYAHGEKKKQWQFLLTETASLKLDELAQAEGVSRSEYMERLIRNQSAESTPAGKLEVTVCEPDHSLVTGVHHE